MGELLCLPKRVDPLKHKHIPFNVESCDCDGCNKHFKVEKLFVDNDGKLLCQKCVNSGKEFLLGLENSVLNKIDKFFR